MADRKAVNRYYPPDFDPSKHGSINKYRNSHPLRERAKRLSEGILVIRFEMPYNIWCGGCGNHIGMGVRYNADKTKVGNYYSTPIYRFRMKCHLCDNYFEMETNPMECDYTIVTGAYRKNQKWDMAENEQVLTEDRQTVKKLASDAMFKLEHGVDDSKKLEAVAPTLQELEQTQTSWKDDFDQNRLLRQKFRTEKQKRKISAEEDEALLSKSSLAIQLVPESEEDRKLATLLKYNAVESSEEKQKKKRLEISGQSIFSSRPSKATATVSSPQAPPGSLSLAGLGQGDKLARVRQRLGLPGWRGASKRGLASFDDFNSGRKVTPRDGPTGIVVAKRRKDRSDSGGCLEDAHEGRKDDDVNLIMTVDGGVSEDSPALRGVAGFRKASPDAHTDSDRVPHPRDNSLDRGGHEDEQSNPGSATRGASEASDGSRLPTDSALNTSRQKPDAEPESRAQTGGLIERDLASSNGFTDPGARHDISSSIPPRSLVSCDYSSSDSDE